MLVLGAFQATHRDQHVDVEQFCFRWRAGGRDDTLHDDEATVRRHRLPAVAQDFLRGLVIPVVDDALEQVGGAAARNGLEEVAGNEACAVRQAGLCQ